MNIRFNNLIHSIFKKKEHIKQRDNNINNNSLSEKIEDQAESSNNITNDLLSEKIKEKIKSSVESGDADGASKYAAALDILADHKTEIPTTKISTRDNMIVFIPIMISILSALFTVLFSAFKINPEIDEIKSKIQKNRNDIDNSQITIGLDQLKVVRDILPDLTGSDNKKRDIMMKIIQETIINEKLKTAIIEIAKSKNPKLAPKLDESQIKTASLIKIIYNNNQSLSNIILIHLKNINNNTKPSNEKNNVKNIEIRFYYKQDESIAKAIASYLKSKNVQNPIEIADNTNRPEPHQNQQINIYAN